MSRNSNNLFKIISSALLLALLSITASGAAIEDKKPVWSVAKSGRVLELTTAETVKMNGKGLVNFKRDGRLIEFGHGYRMTINHQPINGERRVYLDESIEVLNSRNEVAWQLSFAAPPIGTGSSAKDNFKINGGEKGNFDLYFDTTETIFFQKSSAGIVVVSQDSPKPPTPPTPECNTSSHSETTRTVVVNDDNGPSYQMAVGRKIKLEIVNSNGRLLIEKQDDLLSAKINSIAIDSRRIVREGSLVRVVAENGETRFLLNISPQGALVYSPQLDPYSSRARVGINDRNEIERSYQELYKELDKLNK